MSNEQQIVAPTPEHAQGDAEHAERERRFDHPDRRGPRGNQEIERTDVERGREQLDRILGW